MSKPLSIAVTIMLIFFKSPEAISAPVLLSSSQALKPTPSQVETLNHQAGIDSTQYHPEHRVLGFTLMKPPENLGRGILIGRQENLASARHVVRTAKDDKTKTSAQGGTSEARKSAFAGIEAELGLSVGYRLDEFDWNIAGNNNGNNPNVLSELTWDDLEIFQVKIALETIISKVLYVRGSFDYGWILDGVNQDSDFSGDNRTLEWSRSNNSADDGNVLDASLGFGYQFRLAKDKFRITPLVGFSYHEQNLTITDGVQTVSEPALAPPGVSPPPLGPFAGLDGTYDAEWIGPWVGIDLLFRPNEKLSIITTFEYHWAYYEAKANWNLRTDLAHPKSFEHDANGDGIFISAGFYYAVDDQWSVDLILSYQDWSTDQGTDRIFFADGTQSETQLNEVNWQSCAIMLGFAYRF
ncbi:MAG: TonB-dependent receptor [Deltaproteobacteria bacterium]|nr:MAG: TonB-dependent receptor [Deltaproteobacteria bacterium]